MVERPSDLQTAAVEHAGERVAAGARQQILIALAVCQHVEHVGDARGVGPALRAFEPAQIGANQDAVERDRAHLSGPAAQQHRQRRAGEQIEPEIEAELVEAEDHRAGEHQPQQNPVGQPGARLLVDQDEQDAIDEQQRRAPHHQRAHLVEKSEIRDPVRPQRDQAVMTHQRRERDHQEVADQQAIDRLADDLGVLADIDQQQQHQLSGEQDARSRRGDDAERKLDVEDAGEIGLDEMHHAERAKEGADAEPVANPEQPRQHQEIEQRVGCEQQQIVQSDHARSRACRRRIPHLTAGLWARRVKKPANRSLALGKSSGSRRKRRPGGRRRESRRNRGIRPPAAAATAATRCRDRPS